MIQYRHDDVSYLSIREQLPELHPETSTEGGES